MLYKTFIISFFVLWCKVTCLSMNQDSEGKLWYFIRIMNMLCIYNMHDSSLCVRY